MASGEPQPSDQEYGSLSTEGVHPGAADLDLLESVEAVGLLLDEDRRGLEQARAQSRALAEIADLVARVLAAGGDVVLAGAGTSGRLAVLEAAECPPTFGTEPERIRAVIAGGAEAVFAALEGSEDREDEGRAAAATLGPGDLMIGISASSVTRFTRGALAGARAQGARSVLLTCASKEDRDLLDEIEGVVDRVLALDTGPEVLAGSTRLKAGSATKAALNAITTVAMIRLGKVYRSYMVDVRPGSAKLRDRTVRIVANASEISRERATELLALASGEAKTAIVMARGRVTAVEARRLLDRARGSVRDALDLALSTEESPASAAMKSRKERQA